MNTLKGKTYELVNIFGSAIRKVEFFILNYGRVRKFQDR